MSKVDHHSLSVCFQPSALDLVVGQERYVRRQTPLDLRLRTALLGQLFAGHFLRHGGCDHAEHLNTYEIIILGDG